MTTYARALLHAAGTIVTALRMVITWLVIVSFGYMIVAVLAQVAGRYVFGFSLDWVAETAVLSQIWMILLAAGLAMRQNLHVGVDALVNAVSVTVLRLLIIVIGIFCLWFIWQAIAGSIALIHVGHFQTTPVLKIPMWISYLCLPVGLAYFGLELILSLVAKWKNPKGTVLDDRKPIT